MINRILGKTKNIIPEYLTIFDLLLYALVITLCFLLFQHPDLFHTSSSSYAYLHGHVMDFYDYNKNLVGKNDYLPLIYIIFAIWNIPLKLFGLLHNVASSGITLSVIELVWTKLLLVVFYFATTYVISLIGKAIKGNSKKPKYIAIIFATSPIAIFATFIFGQYDIIGLFFTMLGFYYYIRKDNLKFSILFSIAISIKYFPLIIFIPLLLLSEKRIIYIIKYGIISLGATLLQMVIYYNNLAFRNQIFVITNGEVSSLANFTLSPINKAPYLLIIYAIICIYAYIKNVDEDSERDKNAVYISLLSYAIMFSAILWHPQWLLILMPFFALSYLFVKDMSKSFLLDIIGMFSFIYLVENFFPNNVDANMLGFGILRSWFTYIPLSNSKLFLPQYLNLFMGIFCVYLFSPLLVQLFQKSNKDNNIDINKNNKYLRSRFYIGLAIFVVPSLFCALAPKTIARKIDPTAYSISGLNITQAENTVGYITKNNSVKQSFIAENNKLFSIGIELATWARINNCDVVFSLLDEKNNLIAIQSIDGKTIIDNALYKFTFTPIEYSKGKKYYIQITSNATDSNSITAWKSNTDVYITGKLEINGKDDIGDLCIALLYDR
jgi:hypothetical protein